MPFHLNKNLTIKGGYDATTDVQDLDNPSVLSGDFNGDDMVTGSGTTLSITGNDENSYHVVVIVDLTDTSLLEGFEIQGGNADGSSSITYSGSNFVRLIGGGLINPNSDLMLSHVTFAGNSAVVGGGMYTISSPTLADVNFFNNSASSSAGGLFNENSASTIITNCTFSGNLANSSGGGMSNINSSTPQITNTSFIGNAAAFGGGVNNDSSSNPNFTNVIFSGNTAESNGGGVNNGTSATPTFTNIAFIENVAENDGGGMYNSLWLLSV